MNGKERLASAVLIITLAIGVIVDALHQAQVDNCVPTADGQQLSSPSAHTQSSFRKLDINVATAEQLVMLPGIGPKKAKAIVDWRAENGPFEDLDQLLQVSGVGERTLERIRAYVCLDRKIMPESE